MKTLVDCNALKKILLLLLVAQVLLLVILNLNNKQQRKSYIYTYQLDTLLTNYAIYQSSQIPEPQKTPKALFSHLNRSQYSMPDNSMLMFTKSSLSPDQLGGLFWGCLIFAFLLLIILLSVFYYFTSPIKRQIKMIKKHMEKDGFSPIPESGKSKLQPIIRALNKWILVERNKNETLKDQLANTNNQVKTTNKQLEFEKTINNRLLSHHYRLFNEYIANKKEIGDGLPINFIVKDNTAPIPSIELLNASVKLHDYQIILSAEITPKLQSCSIINIIDKVFLSIHDIKKNTNINITTLICHTVPETALFDPNWLHKILLYLIENSIKFTKNGAVSLRVDTIDDKICFCIKDNGIGIETKNEAYILSPFVQLDKDTSGIGLGLTLCHRLVQEMAGELLIHSRYQKGSTFTLLLPLESLSSPLTMEKPQLSLPLKLHPQAKEWNINPVVGEHPLLSNKSLNYLPGQLWQQLQILYQEQAAISAISPEPSVSFNSPWTLKVLLVDDIPSNRKIVSHMLYELDHEVFIAASGEQALSMGEQHIFDVILMDIRMPGISGFETTQRWRQQANILDPDCPIFALTANAGSIDDQQINQIFDDFISKPVTLEKLNHSLEYAIRIQQKRQISLTPSTKLNRPIFDTSKDKQLLQQLKHHLSDLLMQSHQLLKKQQWQELSDVLHTIKGSAGMAKFNEIANSAQTLEVMLEDSGNLNLQDFNQLQQQIDDFIQS